MTGVQTCALPILPQSILQAMAGGVPVVATKVGGVPEVVVNEETGILVEPGDPQALAGGIIRVLNDPPLTLRVTANAVNLAGKEYSVVRMVDKIESIYKDLLIKRNKSFC